MKLLKFSAEWCTTCKMMSRIFEELETEYGNKFEFINLDLTKDEGSAKKYNILGLPTVIIMDGDKEIERITGARPKNDLMNMLNRVVSKQHI